jgi:hypothetical protein
MFNWFRAHGRFFSPAAVLVLATAMLLVGCGSSEKIPFPSSAEGQPSPRELPWCDEIHQTTLPSGSTPYPIPNNSDQTTVCRIGTTERLYTPGEVEFGFSMPMITMPIRQDSEDTPSAAPTVVP